MKIMYLCITKTFKKQLGYRQSIYECTRKYWKLVNIKKAFEAEYIVGLSNGEIKGIYKNINWDLVKNFPEFLDDIEVKENPGYLDRYAFTADEVSPKEQEEIEQFYKENSFKFQGRVIAYNF